MEMLSEGKILALDNMLVNWKQSLNVALEAHTSCRFEKGRIRELQK